MKNDFLLKVIIVQNSSHIHVSPLLRGFFVIHFVADILFALPLFLCPEWTMTQFGWTVGTIDPLTVRLVACALFGIGIESLLGKNASDQVYLAMLNLKSIWSVTATISIAWSIMEWKGEVAWGAWLFLLIFSSFCLIWNGYRIHLRRLLNT